MNRSARTSSSIAILVIAVAGAVVCTLPRSKPEAGDSSGGTSAPSRADPVDDAAMPAKALAAVPFAEPKSETSDADTARKAVVAVQHADATPAAGARVVVFRAADVLASGVTNEQGLLEIPDWSGAASIGVAAPGYALVVEDAEGGRERHRISLPAGGEVSGIVKVDGAPPGEPLKLVLQESRERPSKVGLPPATAKVLGEDCGATRATIATDAEGAFRFRGLPPRWAGSLWWPEEFRRVQPTDGESGLSLAKATSGLVIELRRLPTLRGRIVTVRDGRPVPFSEIDVSFDVPGGGGSLVRTDAKGRFGIVLDVPGIRRVILRPSEREGGGFRKHVLDERWAGGGDVGDVPIWDSRTLRYTVRDSSGVPIRGASALSAERVCTFLEPGENPTDLETWPLEGSETDDQGEGSIEIDETVQRLRLRALGRIDREVATPPASVEHIDVVLEPAACGALEILVRAPDGSVPAGIRIWFRAKEASLAGASRDWHASSYTVPGQAFSFFKQSERGTFGSLEAIDGHVCVAGIRIGSTLRVEAVGAPMKPSPELLAAADVRITEPMQTVTLIVDRRARVFQGSVVDDAGRPIADASVEWNPRAPYPERPGVWTSEDGRFHVPDVYSETVELRVQQAGHAPFLDPQFPVPADGSEVRIVLPRAYDLRVRVRDRAGRDVVPDSISASINGSSMEVRPPRYLTFHDLPPGRFRFTARAGGRYYEATLDTTAGEGVIPVPPHGSLRVLVPCDRSIHLRGVIQPEGGVETLILWDVLAPSREGHCEASWSFVAAGKYRLTVERVDSTGTSERRDELPARDIEIKAGAETVVSWLP